MTNEQAKELPEEQTPIQEQPPQSIEEKKVLEEQPPVDLVDLYEEAPVDTPQEKEVQPNQIDTLIESLKTDLALRTEQEGIKDATIQRMSKQIETFEVGVFRKIKDGLLSDLILLYDSVEKIEHRFSNNNDKLNIELELLKDEIEEIMFRNDVEKITEPTVTHYDRAFQKVIGKEATEVEAEHLMILRIAKQGFKAGDRILRKQEIYVKEYTQISENNPPQNS
ncbi:nucleotide exchange factor GrpE [Runella sp.]|uniref:nucleotide exchange factor GrpE n=1 Tax=Runella sp. TaxID=1960881 RepID=UPI00301594E8